MIELIGEQLRQLQMIQLEMLIEVDRICNKCGIQYNIIAGTLLGAIRHGGYIGCTKHMPTLIIRPKEI